MDFKKEITDCEHYVVVCERDVGIDFCKKHPELKNNSEPMVFETRIRHATKKNAINRRASLNGQYGKCYIAKLDYIKEEN